MSDAKEVRDEIGLKVGRGSDGEYVGGIVFVHHGMTEDVKPVVFCSPEELETLALNMVRLAWDLRRKQEDDRG